MRHIALALIVATAPLAAQQPAAPPQPVTLTLDLGFVNTAGNTKVTSVNAGEKLTYQSGRMTLTQTFSMVYARQDSVTNASQWKGGARGDVQVSGPVGVFVMGAFERNTFAGIERRFEEAAGLAVKVLAQLRNTLTLEAGASLNQQTPVGGATATFAAGRAAGLYRRGLTQTAFFLVTGEFLPNLEDTEDYRVNGEASLVAPISTRIATKLTYAVRFDHLPEPGFEHTDRIFTAGLQISF